MFKVGDLVHFTPEPHIFDLFDEDYKRETKTAIVLRVKSLLKRVDILTQTENIIYKNISFSEIQKIK